MSKKKKKSKVKSPHKASTTYTKLPVWVKLFAGGLSFGVGLRVFSAFNYFKSLPESDEINRSMFNPFTLLNLKNPWIINQNTFMLSFILALLVPMAIVVWEDSQKKRRSGIEQGSAQWIPHECSLDFRDDNYFNNQIFTETELYSRNMWMSRRNRNILLLGRPGTGKSRYYFIPNILQRLEGSFVVTDPKGELLQNTGYALRQAGYTIKVLNLYEMWKSNHYNPFNYLKFVNKDTQKICVNLTEEQIASKKYKLVDADVLQVIDTIIKNTNGKKDSGSSDPFWDKAEQLYLQSIMYYIVYNYPKDKQNFKSVLDLMRKSEAPADGVPSGLDMLFDEWEFGRPVRLSDGNPLCNEIDDDQAAVMNEDPVFGNMGIDWTDYVEKKVLDVISEDDCENYILDPDDFVREAKWKNVYGIECQAEGTENVGLKQWHHFKSGVKSEKTMASIMLSAAARLAPLNIPEVDDFINDDDMELERIGMPEPTPSIPNGTSTGGRICWFIITKPNEQAFNFIANLFYTQCFQIVDLNAKNHAGSCPTPVDMYMDEWAQLGEIPSFVELLSYVRGLNCGITIGLQSLDQLKNVYKDSWQTVLDDCDFILFLGSTSKDTLEYIVTLLGKETINKRSQSRSYGKSGSSSHSDDVLGRDLMDIQELKTMGEGNCVLMDMKETRGSGYFSKLYNLTAHPRYNLLFEPRNDKDPENMKRQYDHADVLQKEREKKNFNNFYLRMGIDPEKVKILREEKVINSEELQYTPNIMSPDQFLESAQSK